MHGHGVHILVFDSYAGKIRGNFVHSRAPHLRDFENVCLVDTGELLAACLCEFEGDPGNAGHLIAGVVHGIPSLAGDPVPLARVAKIQAAQQFTDKENVGAVDDLWTKRTGNLKFLECERRTEVGKATKRSSELQ